MTILARGLGIVVLLAVAAYLACVTWLFIDQRRLIFHPYPYYAPPTASNSGAGMREFPVETDDGLKLRGWYHPASPGKLTIVFFHGNADGVITVAPLAAPFVRQGYGFLIVEYRGYSRLPGTPSQDGFYRDGRAYIHALEAQGVPDGGMVAYGHSLGTGVATEMASEFKFRGLALLAPFLSVGSIAQLRYPLFPAALLTTDQFDSAGVIGQVHCPVLIGHGSEDRVVPVDQGRSLFALANEPKTLTIFPTDGHMNAFGDFAAVMMPWLGALQHGKAVP